MKKNKEAVKWVLLTILAGVLGEFCVKPIVGVIRSYTGTIIGSFVNYYYYCCATSNISDLLSQVALIVIFAFYIYPVVDGINTIKKIKNYNKGLKETKNQIIGMDTPESEKEIEVNLEQKIEDIQKEIKWSDKQIKKLSFLHKIMIFLIMISFINSVAFTIYPYMERTKFDETIIKITPYVERTEIDVVKSDWTQMRNYEDYLQIKTFVDNTIENNNLK